MKLRTLLLSFKYPIIKRFFVAQTLLFLGASVVLFIACVAIEQFRYEKQIESQKAAATMELLPFEDKLLAFSSLHMDKALEELVSELKSKFKFQALNVVDLNDLKSLKLHDLQFVMSSEDGQKYGQAVIVELNASEIQRFHFSTLAIVMILSLGVVVLGLTLFATHFMFSQVFRPIYLIHRSLDQLESTDQIEWENITAMGEVKMLLQSVHRLYLKSVQREEDRIRAEVAEGVAHDIRSPLGALRILAASADGLSNEDRKLLTNVCLRISEILSDLDAAKKRNGKLVSTSLISKMVEQIVHEKTVTETAPIHVADRVGQDLRYIFCEPHALKRMLSNFINNSIDAECSRIDIRMWHDSDGALKIEIWDDGNGIPEVVLPELAKKGFSYNKPNGKGIGLYQARTLMEAWGGSLSIQSEEASFCCIILKFPSPYVGIENSVLENAL